MIVERHWTTATDDCIIITLFMKFLANHIFAFGKVINQSQGEIATHNKKRGWNDRNEKDKRQQQQKHLHSAFEILELWSNLNFAIISGINVHI